MIMRGRKKRKVFVSGKVSGLAYLEACRQFYDASHVLLRLGYKPILPIELCRPWWRWWRCMVVCLWHLMWCDCFCQLDNWKDSRGARIEYRVARILRKKFIEL